MTNGEEGRQEEGLRVLDEVSLDGVDAGSPAGVAAPSLSYELDEKKGGVGKVRMPTARQLAGRKGMTKAQGLSVIEKLLPDMLAIKAAAAYAGDHRAAGDIINKIIPDLKAVDGDSGGGVTIIFNQKVYGGGGGVAAPRPEQVKVVSGGGVQGVEISFTGSPASGQTVDVTPVSSRAPVDVSVSAGVEKGGSAPIDWRAGRKKGRFGISGR